MSINIDGFCYKINDDEFTKIQHKEYNYLKMYNDIAQFERLLGVIKKTFFCFNYETVEFISYDTTHGGFIPINLVDKFNSIYVYCDNEHIQNVSCNIDNKLERNQKIIKVNEYQTGSNNINCICLNVREKDLIHYNNDECIFITTTILNCDSLKKYKLKDTKYLIYVGKNKQHIFKKVFIYFIDG